MSKNSIIVGGFILLAVVIGSYMILSNIKPANKGENLNQMTSTTNKNPTASSSGQLKIEDIIVGTGQEAKAGDTVVMNYLGTLEDGTKFDSSYDRGQPFTTQIGVGQVIQGWDEGVPGMKIGGKRKLIIPSQMAYGDRAIGNIPPNSTLIFEVELLDIKQ